MMIMTASAAPDGAHREAATARSGGVRKKMASLTMEPARDQAYSAQHPARVVLIDDHAILREGLIALSDLENDLEVVGQAANLEDGLRIALGAAPDLIVTDLSLGRGSSVQGIAEFRGQLPDTRILVLTMHDSEEHIRAALAAGAHGYVLKDATRVELLQAMRAVLGGERHLCARASARVVRSYLGEQRAAPQRQDAVTGREREILTMIAAGLSNKRIAIELHRSVKTVEKHRANLMRKLQLHNVAEVTRFAVQQGLLVDSSPT